MLFQHTWEQVLSGTQTAISLPVKPDDVMLQDPKRVKRGPRTIWKVGNTYTVQPGKGKKVVGRILLQEIDEGVLGQLGIEDFLAEGFTSRGKFVDAWKKLHGHYDPNQPIWILRFERDPTPEEKAARKRIEQEKRLWNMANKEFDKLSAVGHVLEEWQSDGDLRLKSTCRRCHGSVTISVGEINMVGYIPLMRSEECLADYPEYMDAANRELESKLARVYRLLISAARKRKQGENQSQSDVET